MESDGRKEYIDLMKGIAMVLVIASHTLSFSGGIGSVLSNLRNPPFYFASGILFASTLSKLEERQLSVRDILLKKFYRIAYPCIIWTFLYSLLEICFIYTLDDTTPVLFYIVFDAVNRLWFLPVLLFALLANYVIWRINVNKKLITVVWIISIFVSTLYSSAIGKIIFFSFIVWLGILCARVYSTFRMLIIFITMYAIACYFAFFSGGGYFSEEDSIRAGYRLFLLFVIGTIGAFVMWCAAQYICKYIKGKSISVLSVIGKNSIYFYILHNLPIYCFKHIETQFLAMKICCFLMGLLVPILYIKFVKKTLINKYLFCTM